MWFAVAWVLGSFAIMQMAGEFQLMGYPGPLGLIFLAICCYCWVKGWKEFDHGGK